MTKKKAVEKKTFKGWFETSKPAGMSDTEYMKVLDQKSGVSRETFRTVLAGMRITSYKLAKRLETLTGIPAIELLEG